jgi:uncharacterized protein YndB with AHSA1/START domain
MASDRTPRTPGFRPPAGDDHESRDVRRRVVIEAPPEDVWRALTDPDELAAWWGDDTELDATPGGEGRFVEDGEPVRLARVVEASPERRLMLDWWPEDPDVDEPATRVTIELVPCPFGTVVTVLECALLDLSALPVLAAPRQALIPGTWSPRLGGRTLAHV